MLAALIVLALAGTSAVVEAAEAEQVAEEAERPEPVASSMDDEDEGMAAVEGADGDAEPEPVGGEGDDVLPGLPVTPAPRLGVAVVLALERDASSRVDEDHVLGFSSQTWDTNLSARGPPTAC